MTRALQDLAFSEYLFILFLVLANDPAVLHNKYVLMCRADGKLTLQIQLKPECQNTPDVFHYVCHIV